MRSLQTETNSLLNSYQQQRQKMRQQQAKELAAFVIFLQAEAQDHLDQLAAQRPIRTSEIQQMLKLDRIHRQSSIETLFQELAIFRSELRQYRQNLSQLVWGETIQADELLANSTVEIVSDSSIAETIVEAELQVAIEPPESPVVEMAKPTIEPAKPVASEPIVIAPMEDPWAEIGQPTRALLQTEERIYDYLAKQQGARLTEIETLGLTRFQIVDALRSLTQKGLVWQRDRLYFAKD
ncbi:MAG: hypothetical protein HC895_18730 [Leptolyngbyaceae cyanobacterium SM1_3_5]|nr:hypothetical protein [Leptolyngbyaceae cyanobacterium SM1_3_5]